MAQQQTVQQPARTYGHAQFRYVPLLLQEANSSGQQLPASYQHGFTGILKPIGRWSRQFAAQLSSNTLQVIVAILQQPLKLILALLRLPGVAYKLARSLLSTRIGKLLTATVLFLICIEITCQQRKKETSSNETGHQEQMEASFMCSLLQDTVRLRIKLRFSRPQWLAKLYCTQTEQQQVSQQTNTTSPGDELQGGVNLRPIQCPVGSHASQQELNQTILHFLAQQQWKSSAAQDTVFQIASPCHASHIDDTDFEDNLQGSPRSRRCITRGSSCPLLATGLSRAASGPTMASSLSDITPTAPHTATCGMTSLLQRKHTSYSTLQTACFSHKEQPLLPLQHTEPPVVDQEGSSMQHAQPIAICQAKGWHIHCNDLISSPEGYGRGFASPSSMNTTPGPMQRSPWLMQEQHRSWTLHKNNAFLPRTSSDRQQGCFEQPCLKPSSLQRQAREHLQDALQTNGACAMPGMQAVITSKQARVNGGVGNAGSYLSTVETCHKLKSNLSAPSPSISSSPASSNISTADATLRGMGPPVRSGAAETAAAAAIYRAARSGSLSRSSTVRGSGVVHQQVTLNESQHTINHIPTPFTDVSCEVKSNDDLKTCLRQLGQSLQRQLHQPNVY